MSSVNTLPKTEHLTIRLTCQQKEQIKEKAKSLGFLTVTDYVLAVSLGDKIDDKTRQRQLDAPLIKARLYADLGQLIDKFKLRKVSNPVSHQTLQPIGEEELREAIALLHEIRRAIALNRLEIASSLSVPPCCEDE